MGKALPSRVRTAGTLAFVVLFICLGCSGRPDREAGSALWVETEDVALLDDEVRSQMAAARIKELFVPLADVGAGGALERRPMPELPAGVRVSVVVAGGNALPADAGAVAEGLRRIFADVQSRGAVPAGVHFDVAGLDKVGGAASFFKKLRGQLGPGHLVSLSLRASWVDDPGVLSLAGAVDFVVAFLYGDREDEPESTENWDLEVVRRRLGELEKAGSYLLGVSGVGRATRTGRGGKVEKAGTEHAPHTFMWNRGLRLKRGIDPEDADRPVYTLVAENGARAGGWEIGSTDEVRIVWPTTYYLRKVLDLVDQGDYRRHLGQLYYRLPAPEEGLSISVENIANALAGGPEGPELAVEVQVSRRGRGSTRFRFVLINTNGEPSEYSLLGNNYLQVKTAPNTLGRVNLGDFYRYDLLRLDADGGFERAIRNSNAVRLHAPVLEGHQRVASGEVIVHRRDPELEIEAKFLMPDGHSVELGPLTWKDGELQAPE